MKKAVREAVKRAVEAGWTFLPRTGKGHALGILRCPHGCHSKSVWSTPRSPEGLAREIDRIVAKCQRENAG